MFKILDYLNPEKDESVLKYGDVKAINLPVIWMLGKTGAGKSSFIHFFTPFIFK